MGGDILKRGVTIYRSEDYGASWKKGYSQSGYSWYAGQVAADPRNPDRLFLCNGTFYVSEDGGTTIKPAIGNAHTDEHAVWIDPYDSDHLIIGSDGGFWTTHDSGVVWTHAENLPIAQYYAIAVDQRSPNYYIYGGMQDNESYMVPSRTRNLDGIIKVDWVRIYTGDGFYAAVDPDDPNIVYTEAQGGSIARYDVRSGENQSIQPAPEPGERKYNWNWSTPIFVGAPGNALYIANTRVFRSRNHGVTWQVMSPDLTRQLKGKFSLMGLQLPYFYDYGSISMIDESPVKQGLFYVGTNDGLVQVSRDDGKNWTRIDHFPGVPENTPVSYVFASRNAPETAYVSFSNTANEDARPMVFRTIDAGKTWTAIAGDLPVTAGVRSIVEHPRQPSLLFAGTEIGAFVSFNGGQKWQPLRGNMPAVRVIDLRIQEKENDLVAGTWGRGIYVLDDLTPLENLAAAQSASQPTVFPVRPAAEIHLKDAEGFRNAPDFAGTNPPAGAIITYFIPQAPKGVKGELTITDASGKIVRHLPADISTGLHRTSWNLREQGVPRPGGTAAPPSRRDPGGPMTQGPFVAPGEYKVHLDFVPNEPSEEGTERKDHRGQPSAPVAPSSDIAILVNADPMTLHFNDAERKEVEALGMQVTILQGKVEGALRVDDELKAQVMEARVALHAVGTHPELIQRADELLNEIADIHLKIQGPELKETVDSNDWYLDPSSIANLIGQVYYEIRETSFPPTDAQKNTMTKAQSLFEAQVARINKLLAADVPTFDKALDEAGVPWTIGRKLR
jgi:hypothetical protein